VPFDPADIDQDRSYVVTAGIFDASNRWVNDTGVPVITKGNPLAGITVPVAPPGAAPSANNGLGTLGTILAIVGIVALIIAIVVFFRSRRPPTATGAAAPGPDTGPGDGPGPAAADRTGPEPGGPPGPA
jgi:hypothetical protein